jgi:hypothetical protein
MLTASILWLEVEVETIGADGPRTWRLEGGINEIRSYRFGNGGRCFCNRRAPSRFQDVFEVPWENACVMSGDTSTRRRACLRSRGSSENNSRERATQIE